MTDFLRLLEGLKHELAESQGVQDLALTHFICFLWYPFKTEKYWWCAMLLMRPTVIAFFYNARDRGTSLVLGTIDWRALVICFLMCYTTVQVRGQMLRPPRRARRALCYSPCAAGAAESATPHHSEALGVAARQAIAKPFKLAHEQTLDSVAVLLLMTLFVVNLNIEVADATAAGGHSGDAVASTLMRVRGPAWHEPCHAFHRQIDRSVRSRGREGL